MSLTCPQALIRLGRGGFFGLSPQAVTGLISPLARRHAKISKAQVNLAEQGSATSRAVQLGDDVIVVGSDNEPFVGAI
jgi:hypothetical protein